MAFIHSPKTVTDGLVLCLDAANPKSYVSGSTSWYDLSYSGYSGSLLNNVGYSPSNVGTLTFNATSGSFARITNAANFNPISQDSQSFSISCWVKGAVTSSGNVVIGQDWGNTGNGWNGLRLRPEVIIFQVGNNTTGTQAVDYSNLLSTTTFKHYTGVYNGTQVLLYTNGTLVNTASTSVYPKLNDSRKTWTVGGNYQRTSPADATFLTGEIPLVQFYNRALSADEILQNYNATKGRYGL